jgi:hypothetical protein
MTGATGCQEAIGGRVFRLMARLLYRSVDTIQMVEQLCRISDVRLTLIVAQELRRWRPCGQMNAEEIGLTFSVFLQWGNRSPRARRSDHIRCALRSDTPTKVRIEAFGASARSAMATRRTEP